jgi:hypothetical protein
MKASWRVQKLLDLSVSACPGQRDGNEKLRGNGREGKRRTNPGRQLTSAGSSLKYCAGSTSVPFEALMCLGKSSEEGEVRGSLEGGCEDGEVEVGRRRELSSATVTEELKKEVGFSLGTRRRGGRSERTFFPFLPSRRPPSPSSTTSHSVRAFSIASVTKQESRVRWKL